MSAHHHWPFAEIKPTLIRPTPFSTWEPAEPEPEPCEYCSIWNGATQEHDGTCSDLTNEQIQDKLTHNDKDRGAA